MVERVIRSNTDCPLPTVLRLHDVVAPPRPYVCRTNASGTSRQRLDYVGFAAGFVGVPGTFCRRIIVTLGLPAVPWHWQTYLATQGN